MNDIEQKNPGKLSDTEWACLLKTKPDEYLSSILDGIETNNRFFVDSKFLKLLYEYAFGCKLSFYPHEYWEPGKKPLFRSRIMETDKPQDEEGPYDRSIFRGYGPERSFVPPKGKSSMGRINPLYICYLYTATDEKTSIIESRATPGCKVSVAEIRIKQLCHFVSFTHRPVVAVGKLDDRKEWLLAFSGLLPNLFQCPDRSDKVYYLCQYISEFYKNQDFDGITFRSAYMPQSNGDDTGVNVTVFSYDKCEVINSKIYHLDSMDITVSLIDG